VEVGMSDSVDLAKNDQVWRNWASMYDINIGDRESVEKFKERLRRRFLDRPVGTLDLVDHACRAAILAACPVGTTTLDTLARRLGIRWLRLDRPSNILARAAWLWRIVKAMWRNP
jgi:hypothetical protein